MQLESAPHSAPVLAEETLPNGLRLATVDLRHTHRAYASLSVRMGPAYEFRANNGVSHFLEHLHMTVSARCPDRDEMTRRIDALPGFANAHTGVSHATFMFGTAPASLAVAGELLAEIGQARDFPTDIVEAERRVILSEQRTSDEVASYNTYYRPIFGDHPVSMPTLGTRRSISRLSIEALHDFERAAFRPERMLCVLAGRLDVEQVSRVGKALEALRPLDATQLPPIPPLQPRVPVYRRLNRVTPYAMLYCGFIAPWDISPAAKAALYALDAHLGGVSSPLRSRVRYGAGDTYEFSTLATQVPGHTIFLVGGLPLAGQRDAFIRATLDEIVASRDERRVGEWLDRLRPKIEFNLSAALDDPAQIGSMLESGFAMDGKLQQAMPTFWLDQIAQLTAGEIAATAAKYLTRDRLLLYFGGNTRLMDRSRVRRMVERIL